MKFSFIPLLTALSLTSAVNAETWYLMAGGLKYQLKGSTSFDWAIPTNSEAECEEAGRKFMNFPNPNLIDNKHRGYVCVKGK